MSRGGFAREIDGPERPLGSGTSPAASRAHLPRPGDTIAGKYLLVGQIGQGGMASVFEAQHLRLRQRLAIKVLRPDVPDFHEVLTRFEREARATAQLRSVHTARIVDVDMLPQGLPYIVMEFLEGHDVETALAAGAMPIDAAADVVSQVADVMEEAHALGIVHRDLKPANLFMCRVGGRRIVKVLDFGISKFEEEGSARLTQADAYFGTPCYTAPEQLRDAGSADARSDVWSLGIILFELLAGRPPFEGTSTSVIAKVMTDPVPWPIDLRPDVPRELARVVMRALDRDPNQRFQTMREFAAAVAPFAPSERASTVVAEAQRSRGRLGEILVADGLVTAQDLERALDEQRRTGQLLGRVLLELKLVSHADLLAALAKQQGVSTSPLPERTHARDADTKITAPKTRAPRSRRRWITLAVAVGLPLAILAGIGIGAAARRAARPAPAAAVSH
jgi:serine/threonine protein kinase